MASMTTRIDTSGVVLTPELKRVLERHSRTMTDVLGDHAAQRIDELGQKDFRYEHSPRTGRYQAGITVNPITGTMPGTRVHVDPVIYGAWIEGTSPRNRRSRFKGYRLFRRTAQEIDGNVFDIVRAKVDQLVRELNR